MPLSEIGNASYVKDGQVIHNPSRPVLQTEELDALPFATEVYQKNLTIEDYNVPFLLHPFVSFYTTRGCPALVPSACGRRPFRATWRKRSVENVAREFKQAHKMFPQAKEFFFDDDTFNIRKDRVVALCKEFKPVGFQWSCTARVHGDYETLKAMADAGCRLLIVGFESGDEQILKNIKKGQTLEMGCNFVKNCKKVGIHVHGDFIIGLPGETKIRSRRQSTSRRTSTAKRSRCPWPTPIPAPNSTTRACAKASSPDRQSPTMAATSSRTSNIPASRRNTWSRP